MPIPVHTLKLRDSLSMYCTDKESCHRLLETPHILCIKVRRIFCSYGKLFEIHDLCINAGLLFLVFGLYIVFRTIIFRTLVFRTLVFLLSWNIYVYIHNFPNNLKTTVILSCKRNEMKLDNFPVVLEVNRIPVDFNLFGKLWIK